ncbi:MAG: hypothetical protein M3Y36_10310 [Actinomycetota bacterium]|nr:hypothetical protein [Actinomycetota bacterium]
MTRGAVRHETISRRRHAIRSSGGLGAGMQRAAAWTNQIIGDDNFVTGVRNAFVKADAETLPDANIDASPGRSRHLADLPARRHGERPGLQRGDHDVGFGRTIRCARPPAISSKPKRTW